MVTQRTLKQARRVMLWSLAAVLALIGVIIAVSSLRVYGTLSTVRAERVEAERSRDELTERTEALQASLSALGTERGIEEAIRTRYPLTKPGEIEFVFVDKGISGAEAKTVSKKSVRDRVIETLTNAWEALVLPLN